MQCLFQIVHGPSILHDSYPWTFFECYRTYYYDSYKVESLMADTLQNYLGDFQLKFPIVIQESVHLKRGVRLMWYPYYETSFLLDVHLHLSNPVSAVSIRRGVWECSNGYHLRGECPLKCHQDHQFSHQVGLGNFQWLVSNISSIQFKYM